MGEYAKFNGQEIKIGTCENMYYLRFTQRARVERLSGNVDPVKDAPALRFRFPWPDEDRCEPGAFDGDFGRAVCIPGATCKPQDHHNVQFVAQAGYNVCLPCPESELPFPFGLADHVLNQENRGRTALIHRNGYRGKVLLVQQRFIPAIGLVPILMCGGCGTKYRLEDVAEIEALAVAARSEGDKRPDAAPFWNAIADRILAGIGITNLS